MGKQKKVPFEHGEVDIQSRKRTLQEELEDTLNSLTTYVSEMKIRRPEDLLEMVSHICFTINDERSAGVDVHPVEGLLLLGISTKRKRNLLPHVIEHCREMYSEGLDEVLEKVEEYFITQPDDDVL